jgi:hypothetical protein
MIGLHTITEICLHNITDDTPVYWQGLYAFKLSIWYACVLSGMICLHTITYDMPSYYHVYAFVLSYDMPSYYHVLYAFIISPMICFRTITGGVPILSRLICLYTITYDMPSYYNGWYACVLSRVVCLHIIMDAFPAFIKSSRLSTSLVYVLSRTFQGRTCYCLLVLLF